MVTVTEIGTGTSAYYEWTFDTSYAWDFTIYLKGISMGLNSAIKEVRMFVCGKEELKLAVPGDLVYTYAPYEVATLDISTFFLDQFILTKYTIASDPNAF